MEVHVLKFNRLVRCWMERRRQGSLQDKMRKTNKAQYNL